MKTKYLFGLALLAGATLCSCQADIDAPELKVPQATLQANISIADFKTEFADVLTVGKIGVRPDGSHYVVKGRVVSSDATGNIYSALYIQDETAALPLSINRGSLYTVYPLGQEVLVDLTGMWVGQYNEMMQVGDYYVNGETPQPGRMLYARFANQSQLNGLPNTNFKYVRQNQPDTWPAANPYCVICTVEGLPSAGEQMRNLCGQLVEFHNMHFEDAGKETFAPYQENASRNLIDQKGGSIVVRNSGYSSFWADILPEGEGSVRGILSYYGGTWQLYLRSPEDIMFGSKGKRSDPYTVPEVIAAGNNGMTAWTEGYIVGASKIGVTAISSDADVVFGNDGYIFKGSLLLAPSASCRDLRECVVLQLPQGTNLRDFANLADNPDVLGHRIRVNGSFLPYLGMHGITDSPGSFADFEIEGFEIDAPDGLGSIDLPYTCNYVINNYDTTDPSTVQWVGGYVVGYVSGSDFNAAGAVHFSLPDASADYGNQNLVLGPTADCTDPNLCIVVSTKQKRTELGLKNNPAIFGKLLKVEGTLGTYLNRAAVTTINNYQY